MAFALDGDADLQNRFVAQLRVITSAVSLGHDESLIVHVGRMAPARRVGLRRFAAMVIFDCPSASKRPTTCSPTSTPPWRR